MKSRLLIVLTVSFSSNAQELLVASDIWCPYVCTDNSGYVIELTQQAFASVDINVKFETIPFQRSLKLASNNKIDAVLAVTAEHIRTFELYNNQLVIGQYTNDFFTNNHTDWQFTDLSSLDNKHIASTLGYDYGSVLNKYLKQHHTHFQTSGETPLTTHLHLLGKSRVDAILGNRYVIDYTAKQNGYSKRIRYAGSEGEPTPLYVGFSRSDKGREYAAKFAEGVENIKRSGAYQAILDKYQVNF
ncbi:substrate-binding periplasmic protein [Shewanella sp. 125m-7]